MMRLLTKALLTEIVNSGDRKMTVATDILFRINVLDIYAKNTHDSDIRGKGKNALLVALRAS